MQFPTRRFLSGLALAVSTLALGIAPASAAGAPPSGPSGSPDLVTFGISPAGAQLPDDRPFIAYTAAPGSVIYDHVAIINQDDQSLGLQVYGADVVQAEGGGLSVRAGDQPSIDAGGWLTVGNGSQVNVGPQTKEHGIGFQIVPITVTVPKDAQPGDHVAGVVAALTVLGRPGTNAPAIKFDQRVAARVYVRVPGVLTPGVVITDVHTDWKAHGLFGQGTVTVTYTLKNVGNVRVGVEPSVRYSAPFGLVARSAAAEKINDLLPGASVTQQTTFAGAWAFGPNPVHVDAHVVAPTGGGDPGVGTVRDSRILWAGSWLLLVLLLLVIGLIVWRIRRRRRERRWAQVWWEQQQAARRPADTEAAPTVHSTSTR